MKLKNVHYEYRGNDIWRIYFKDYEEKEAFRNERTDGQKPACSIKVSGPEIRYYVDAKLTGQFNILRYYAKDPTNDHFSSDPWAKLVKKIEGADTNYIFDEIDLRYDATINKCYFRICCMNGTISDFFVKNMLNSQFGMVAQANGYYDTDNAYQGGLCTRRSCCGIGFGHHRDKYGNTEERIIFTVKNFCRGEADIIKVSPWTNTFIGTNKENEKKYSWNDFKKYVQKLSSTGSDIWDIEWKYDTDCPFTGTEVADKLHIYLKPLAYKRLFEEEEREGKKVWISSNSLLWSNNDYLGRQQALTPPPVPYWMKQDGDSKIGFRQKDKDEVQKEIDEMTKKIYEKLEIKQVKDFDVDTAWHEYLNATEMAQFCEYCKRDVGICKEMAEFNASIKDSNSTQEKEANNKEEKNMGPKDTTFSEFCRRIYWGTITPVKPERVLIQGTATIIWWSDGTKTVVKCQKGDKMDPEKGIAMCVMKKFMGTNETHSNYLDFAKPAIKEYEAKQKAIVAARKKAADKKRRAAKKEKENGEA